MLLEPGEGVVAGAEFPFQSKVSGLFQDDAKLGARLQSASLEVIAVEQRSRGLWAAGFGHLGGHQVDVEVHLVMAGGAVEAEQFQEQGTPGLLQETTSVRQPHVLEGRGAHVLSHQIVNGFHKRRGLLEAAKDACRHAGSHNVVRIEADAVGDGHGAWLADIVEQGSPGQGGQFVFGGPGEASLRCETRGIVWLCDQTAGSDGFVQVAKHQQRVGPDIALWMELRRLGDTMHGGDFGKHYGLGQQAG